MAISEAPPRRRRLQFGLGTMLLLVTLFAVWLGWLGWELQFIRERQAWIRDTQMRERMNRAYLFFVPAPTIPWWRRWLGDHVEYVIVLPENADAKAHANAQRLFPEAVIYDDDQTSHPKSLPATARTR